MTSCVVCRVALVSGCRDVIWQTAATQKLSALKLCFFCHTFCIFLKGAEGTTCKIHIRNKQECQKVQVERFALTTMSSANHEEQQHIFMAGS